MISWDVALATIAEAGGTLLTGFLFESGWSPFSVVQMASGVACLGLLWWSFYLFYFTHYRDPIVLPEARHQ